MGNFGDGTINAFDVAKGTQLGTLKDPTGHNVVIPGLWGLLFGNGGRGGDTSTLYFAAGIPGPYGEPVESHGLFGSIQAPPAFTTAVNGASFQPGLAPNTWASIIGGALATSGRSWAATDFTGASLPTLIEGVSVLINGTPAAVSYVGPSQINFLVPSNMVTGAAQIQVNNNDQISAAANVTINSAAPAFFWLTGNKYIAATHAIGTLSGPTTLIAGLTTPAVGGETIVLYGTGFGATSTAPPNNATFVAPLALATLPTVTIGGVAAAVTYGGMIEPGVYQLNVVVPTTLPAGDAAVVATVGTQQSQANAFISVM
ncbi:MAG: IPT/TIG domain-containing protein [Ignavibacteriota bacterium]